MWRGWAIGETHVRRGGITLYDRHPLEALVGANPRRRDHVLARVCPAPDLVIVLDAPPATLHARKPEHPVSIVEQQRAGYASLAASRAGARVVDGTPPMPDVERAVWSEVWQAWRRTRGRHQSVVPV